MNLEVKCERHVERMRYYWTEEVDEFIKSNYAEMGCTAIAEILKLPYRIVQQRALKKLKVSKFSHIDWTDERVEFLKENYPKYGGRYVSTILKLPITAVNKKASELRTLYIPKHSYISAQGYRDIVVDGDRILEHRHVMEVHLGRKLTSLELVHHINGNKLDNRLENLVLTNRSEHIEEHREELTKGRKSS